MADCTCKVCGGVFDRKSTKGHKKCQTCLRQQVYACRERRRSEHPEQFAEERFNNRLWSVFKIRRPQFDLMVAKGCSCCGSSDTGSVNGWHVDHDHSCCLGNKSCGACVRGVLCHPCNVALGQVNDSIERLEQMIRYLKNTSQRD